MAWRTVPSARPPSASCTCATSRMAMSCTWSHGARAPWLQVQLIAILEVAHVQLADGGRALGTVRHAIDHETAHAADALAAIVVEGYRLFVLGDQTFIEYVEHLQERHLRIDIRDFVTHHQAFFARVALPPDMEGKFHVTCSSVDWDARSRNEIGRASCR